MRGPSTAPEAGKPSKTVPVSIKSSWKALSHPQNYHFLCQSIEMRWHVQVTQMTTYRYFNKLGRKEFLKTTFYWNVIDTLPTILWLCFGNLNLIMNETVFCKEKLSADESPINISIEYGDILSLAYWWCLKLWIFWCGWRMPRETG